MALGRMLLRAFLLFKELARDRASHLCAGELLLTERGAQGTAKAVKNDIYFEIH